MKKFNLVFLVLFITCSLSNAKVEYDFTTNWFKSDKIKSWKKNLSELKDKKGLRYLEVGVWEGRSLFWTFENILTDPTSTAVGVDMFPADIRTRFFENLKKSGYEKRFQLFEKRSEAVLPTLQKESFDLIYVDGAHDMKTVSIDAANAWELLKPGGYLVFDDYIMTGFPISLPPKKSVEAFVLANKRDLKIVSVSSQVIVKKNVVLKPWCHECTWFGDYTYRWYERALYLNEKKQPLPEMKRVALEALLVKQDEEFMSPGPNKYEKMAIDLVSK